MKSRFKPFKPYHSLSNFDAHIWPIVFSIFISVRSFDNPKIELRIITGRRFYRSKKPYNGMSSHTAVSAQEYKCRKL
jgi:hypothetical protein